jgi:hypothetical protein
MTATTRASALAARRPTRAPRLAAVAAVALAAVSGCSGGGDEADDGERADPSEDTVNHDPTPVLGDRSGSPQSGGARYPERTSDSRAHRP